MTSFPVYPTFLYCFLVCLLPKTIRATCSLTTMDPCNNTTMTNVLSDDRRDKRTTSSLLCDARLQQGWYKFEDSSGTPLTIPVANCIDANKCGTVVPLFIKDVANTGRTPSPGDGAVERTVCGNFFICCFFSYNICLRKCTATGPTFYYLKPPPGCNLAYCTEGGLPGCPLGQTRSANSKKCEATHLTMNGKPAVKPQGSASKERGIVTLECSLPGVKVDPNETYEYEVEWIRDGVVKVTETVDQNKSAVLVDIYRLKLKLEDQINNPIKLGYSVYCRVRSRFKRQQQDKYPWSSWRQSDSFFLGLSVHPTSVTVHKNDTLEVEITVKPTVPIVCPNNSKDCNPSLSLYFAYKTFVDINNAALSECILNFNDSNWDTPRIIKVSPVQNFREDKNNKKGPVGIRIRPNFNSSTPPPMEWIHQEVAVKVHTTDSPSRQCSSVTDPHYRTFDGMFYSHQAVGEFVLVKIYHRQFEIQTRVWSCRNSWVGASCNCGVAIKEGSDIVTVDLCEWQDKNSSVFKHIPPRVRERSRAQFKEGFGIFKNKDGIDYKVVMRSGSTVLAEARDWGMSIYVTIPGSDVGNTSGLCGNNDGNPNNDFIGPDGQTKSTDTEFVESWRVQNGTNLFLEVDASAPQSQDSTNTYCGCGVNAKVDAASTIADCPFNAKVQPLDVKAWDDYWIPVHSKARRKRAAGDDRLSTYDDDLDDDYVFNYDSNFQPASLSWPTPSNITEEEATRLCKEALESTSVAKACIQSGLIKEIDNQTLATCAEDIKLTDDVSWVTDALSTLEQECARLSFNNESMWEVNANATSLADLIKPPDILQAAFCLRNCSGRGNCVDGACECPVNYTSGDCSVNVNAVPDLYGFSNDGLCDVRRHPCKRAFIIGSGFINSPNLTCHVTENHLNGTKQKSEAEFDSIYEVICSLPRTKVQPGNPSESEGQVVYHLSLSISLDNGQQVLMSQELNYTSYDSVCQECTRPGQCQLKNSSCLIRGYCFASGDPNPDDWCQQCLPNQNISWWSTRIVNSPPVFLSPIRLSVIVGERLEFQLDVKDPEGRPMTLSVNVTGNGLDSNLTDDGMWYWSVPTIEGVYTNFTFQATDECGAKSVPYTPVIDVKQCNCSHEEPCSPDPDYPRGLGHYVCDCIAGYTGKSCESELNECLSIPCLNGSCQDRINGFQCVCHKGYTGLICENEIDECASNPCFASVNCTDLVGGFTCGTCPDGYHGDGRNCTDVDECATITLCPDVCSNYPGGYKCGCLDGYTHIKVDNVSRCQEVDECKNSTACHHVCVNVPGSFHCACVNGYELGADGMFCHDINECEGNLCNQICVNFKGSFQCQCNEGYSLDADNVTCTDINECESSPCHQRCENVNGSFHCSCIEGYFLLSDYRTCTDINECETSLCEHNCSNYPGSFLCGCAEGYKLDLNNRNCSDTNECLEDKPCQQTCVNLSPGFQCLCNDSYTLAEDQISCRVKESTASDEEKSGSILIPIVASSACAGFILLVVIALCIRHRVRSGISASDPPKTS